MSTLDDVIVVEFQVIGVPAPQGSTRAFVVNGRAVTTNKGTKPHMAWRDSVASAAKQIADDLGAPLDGPLALDVEFRFPMPKSRSKRLHAAGSAPKTTAPDVDKTVRSVADALQAGGLVVDDARIVKVTATKLEVVGWTGATVTLSRFEL